MNLFETKNGTLSVNGSIPKDFIIPLSKERYTVNFIGKLDHTIIDWMPFDSLNLFCPEFLKGTLFIDYANPNQPIYLNEEVIQKVNFPDSSAPFKVMTYPEIKLDTFKDYPIDKNYFGQLGEPEWLQEEDWPVSPMTGKKMEFLIQFTFDSLYSSSKIKGSFFDYPPYIFYFLEPETKLVAVLLQMD